jgi:glutaredoxin
MNIEIYTKDACPNCLETKQLLTSNNVDYKEHIVGRDISREDTIAKFPGAKVVPIIVVDGQVTDSGKLQQLLLEG